MNFGLSIKICFSSVNPNTSKIKRMCCKHHISHNQTSVINSVCPVFIH